MLLPIPGSPPIEHERARARCRRRARGRTRRCPRTMRGSSRAVDRLVGLGAGRPRWRARLGRPLPAAGSGAGRSSMKLFHSPQSGQRPSHFELSKPQAWQAKTTLSLLTTRIVGSRRPGRSGVRPPRHSRFSKRVNSLMNASLRRAGRPVALLADDDLGDAAVLVRRLVLLLAVDEHHDVRVLLDALRSREGPRAGAAGRYAPPARARAARARSPGRPAPWPGPSSSG